MSGTREGGLKAAETNKKKQGADFYTRIGAIGGKNSTTGGFASDIVGKDGLTGPERAKIAGAKGGKISRRGKAKHPHVEEEEVEKVKQKGWKWVFGRKGK